MKQLGAQERRQLLNWLKEWRYGDLRAALDFMEPPLNLGHFSSENKGMSDVAMDVIQEVRRLERLSDLLNALADDDNSAPSLKRFCREFLSPSVKPESGEDNDGDVIPYLCDRFLQESEFIAHFDDPAAPLTQIYFLPGGSDGCHTNFVRRLCDWTLPGILQANALPPQGVICRFKSGWVGNPPRGSELKFLTQQLAADFDRHIQVPVLTGANAGGIKQHPKLAGRIVMIELRLYAKYWNVAMKSLLKDYIAFWSAAAPKTARPARFIIIFHVVFADMPGIDPVLVAALDDLAQGLSGDLCRVVRLEPLGCVEWEHVDDWIDRFNQNRRHQSANLKNKFQNGSCLPMSVVEEGLKTFISGR